MRFNTEKTCLCSSRKIAESAEIRLFLGSPTMRYHSRIKDFVAPKTAQCLAVGWGKKPNTKMLNTYAKQHGIDYFRLEDGFISYLKHPSENDSRLSLVIDSTGIYYDATAPSDLENLLNDKQELPDDLISRSQRTMTAITSNKLSKYNHHLNQHLSDSLHKTLTNVSGDKVLLVDQTYGDMSVEYGLAGEHSFTQMLTAALQEYPETNIFVKTHPDVLKGLKQGYLAHLKETRITLITEDCNPIVLLEKFTHVYVVTSQLGFEALMLGKRVSCFGMPFYAGWGLTDDRVKCKRRVRKRTLLEVFAVSYLLYCKYIDPRTMRLTELESILDYLVDETND
ncbi:hypothetical protein OAG1_28420 [Agarivorans sp. OAG1]|uniref:capsular polysaccharide export protein, LipB/KpsS family n=1 Tax=Agarivorans sp. OAG1 TaxID=3082387 RepID=UPI002B2B6C67|nr:hypothetical protein OAG1_28420 [Agarivorans sp. OAG1]